MSPRRVAAIHSEREECEIVLTDLPQILVSHGQVTNHVEPFLVYVHEDNSASQEAPRDGEVPHKTCGEGNTTSTYDGYLDHSTWTLVLVS